ncbi:hypothetical protein [Lentzea terrae]|uniref:hypothetical protein n=1 Tax=Lentzea terrae TaxID=2200761 RepID=UPI0018E5A89A|nr:hypothetical protein [Lentzea terrae]
MTDLSKLTVCRGCCCGTAEKHPGIDHESQLRALREGVGAGNVSVANCLDSCDYSNVVVVRPAPAARAQGARPAWFGGVLGEEATRDILAWVAAGGPGRAAMPDGLVARVIDRKALPEVDEDAVETGE